MNVRPLVIAIAAALAACSVPKVAQRAEAPSPEATPEEAATAGASYRNSSDYSYQLLTPETTGVELVFDDGEYTYLCFPVATPANLMLFNQDGREVPFRKFMRYAVIKGVHAGVLIRTPSSYSYAVPKSPERVAAAKAGQGNPAQLPPDLAAQRAIILQAQAQLTAVQKRLNDPKPKTPQALAAINRELDELETLVNGLQAKMVRVYFASGRSDMALSAPAKSVLLEHARQADKVVIRGRTDSIGAPDANNRVAWARANAAKQVLLTMGVPEPRIEIDRTALTDYIAPNNTKEGRARNRRVEFVFVNDKPEQAAAARTDTQRMD